ncbi:HAD hydrolase, family IIB, partial [human gut metagenome]
MEQKFFFFDIDNTLAVWPEGKIPDSAQYSLDELKRRESRRRCRPSRQR